MGQFFLDLLQFLLVWLLGPTVPARLAGHPDLRLTNVAFLLRGHLREEAHIRASRSGLRKLFILSPALWRQE